MCRGTWPSCPTVAVLVSLRNSGEVALVRPGAEPITVGKVSNVVANGEGVCWGSHCRPRSRRTARSTRTTRRRPTTGSCGSRTPGSAQGWRRDRQRHPQVRHPQRRPDPVRSRWDAAREDRLTSDNGGDRGSEPCRRTPMRPSSSARTRWARPTGSSRCSRVATARYVRWRGASGAPPRSSAPGLNRSATSTSSSLSAGASTSSPRQ